MLDTVAPVPARHCPARFRYLARSAAGICCSALAGQKGVRRSEWRLRYPVTGNDEEVGQGVIDRDRVPHKESEAGPHVRRSGRRCDAGHRSLPPNRSLVDRYYDPGNISAIETTSD
jgi:hypothetical protein